jgi:hypothetical protein
MDCFLNRHSDLQSPHGILQWHFPIIQTKIFVRKSPLSATDSMTAAKEL